MKENQYFRHDKGARNDPKLVDAIFEYGPEAGWSYWCMIEMLYEQGGFLPRGKYYKRIAYQTHCREEVIVWMVEESGLFCFDDERFRSERQLRDQQEYERLLEKKKESGKKGAETKWAKEAENIRVVADAIENDGTCHQKTWHVPSEIMADAIENDGYKEINKYIDIYNNNNICHNSEEKEEVLSDIGQKSQVTETTIQEKQENIYREVREMWNKTVISHKATVVKCRVLNDSLKKKMKVKLKEMAKVGNWREVLQDIFDKVCSDDFCNGKNDRGWKANLEYIFSRNGKGSDVWVTFFEREKESGAKIQSDANGIKNVNELWRNREQQVVLPLD